jgi:predicted nucleotidyltransferase
MDYKNDSKLMGLFRSKARTLLLLNFFINPDKEFYTRELEKKLNIPVGNIRRELKKIESSGLITSHPMGNLVLYKINKENPIYVQFKDLIIKTIGIQELIKPVFAKEKNILTSFLYGSYAKGEFDPSSDIDIFVLVQKDSSFYEKINEKLLEFENMLGREFNADFLTAVEYQRRKKAKDPYILDLLKNPKVFIKGGEDGL